ncbi:MAG: hypothetical protein HWN80_03940 [Candidatus Lokiarchaeota archaeon]|nr:hypothetical protein [Candidatus Lokiarchaeota archaeon]
MKTRNFYILVTSVIIGLVVFWLMMIAFLEFNPFEDPNKITIDGNGTSSSVTLSITDLTSGKYDLVEDKIFHIKNGPPYETEYDVVYSGISLWSIIEGENLIVQSASNLEFRFYARDGYSSPKFLNLSIVEANSDLVILAFEENGVPLSVEGPLRTVMDQSIMPEGEYSSQYSVQKLTKISIRIA